MSDGPYNAEVFRALRDLRKELADERDVPAYVVFSDAVLRAMARELPRTPVQLRAISGVGEKKLADFGARFLEAIALAAGLGPPLSEGFPRLRVTRIAYQC